jgi:hypothetical protein
MDHAPAGPMPLPSDPYGAVMNNYGPSVSAMQSSNTDRRVRAWDPSIDGGGGSGPGWGGHAPEPMSNPPASGAQTPGDLGLGATPGGTATIGGRKYRAVDGQWVEDNQAPPPGAGGGSVSGNLWPGGGTPWSPGVTSPTTNPDGSPGPSVPLNPTSYVNPQSAEAMAKWLGANVVKSDISGPVGKPSVDEFGLDFGTNDPIDPRYVAWRLQRGDKPEDILAGVRAGLASEGPRNADRGTGWSFNNPSFRGAQPGQYSPALPQGMRPSSGSPYTMQGPFAGVTPSTHSGAFSNYTTQPQFAGHRYAPGSQGAAPPGAGGPEAPPPAGARPQQQGPPAARRRPSMTRRRPSYPGATGGFSGGF